MNIHSLSHISFYRYVVLILVFFLIASTGCAPKQLISPNELALVSNSITQGPQNEGKGWWRAAIRIKSVEKTEEQPEVEPLWHVDLFLAHSVMAPIIKKYSKDLTLWRFHRRATPDETGHQFSFAFYSTPLAAQNIFREIANSTLLVKAEESGYIIQQIYDDTTIISHPEISDTSDNDWSSITQKAWPYYIMGTSQMWLTMIDDIIKDNPPAVDDIQSLSDLIDYYAEVNEVVKSLWRDEAQHAFLHHLNAIFGYEPMLYFEPRLIRF
jgi:hypothetical protein